MSWVDLGILGCAEGEGEANLGEIILVVDWFYFFLEGDRGFQISVSIPVSLSLRNQPLLHC